ncbi:MAG TPA: hypothetical protein VFT70_08505 [Nocardioides sp.]|nr:hypothetical protein [Nocardioides sp.]
MPTLTRAASSVGGGVLAAATGGLATLRRARKPLHPSGDLVAGRVFRRGSAQPTGVPWLDEEGQDDAVVRLSRAIGLPGRLPDIHGLAVRVHTGDGYGDLLFATTGRGPLSRFVLVPSRGPRTQPMTTLLPYRSAGGPLVLSADPVGAEAFELSWARPAGDWQVFGCLRLSTRSLAEEISFDPIVHQIDGLEQYPSVRRLREPAYATARHSRDA